MNKRIVSLSAAFLALVLIGCQPSASPPATPVPPTATRLPPTSAPTDTPVPPTATLVPTATPIPPTATPVPPTIPPVPPTSAPLPATDTVCAAGCDFTTIQAAIDDPSTPDGAVIEIADPIHTEAGIIVSKSVTIQGPGADNTIVQAHETLEEAPERVFLIKRDVTVTLKRLTIRHGKVSVRDDQGGGILNYGTLTLENCVVTDNFSDGGGGISSSGGVLTLINSTVSNNTAEGVVPPPGIACGGGGGIKCGSGMLMLINSTVSGNRAGVRDRGWGGGIHVGCNCTAVLINTTISGNRSASDSGAVRVRGRLQLVNCTITNNTAAGPGGGLYVVGVLDYVNTIIANNIGQGGDCVVGSQHGFTFQGEGSIGMNSNNLVATGNCQPDYTDDPLLGPLADNGGATQTHALLPGSPAIDAIPAISCTLPTDQRGALRPAAQTSPDTPCDIGAFEQQGD